MIKKIILNIAIVITVVFILDFVIGKTLRFFYFKESSGVHYRTTYSMDSTKADILIFGSSRANHHYVPEIFEDSLKISYYNTGRDGNGILYQLAVLKSVLNRYTPKIIILDFYDNFEKDAVHYDVLSSLLPYYKNHKEIRNIIELRSPLEKIKLKSEIYPFNSDILTITVGNFEFNKKRKYDNNGYVPIYKEWNEEINTFENIMEYDLDSIRLKATQEFISLSKRSNSKLYVIYSPIFLKFNKHYGMSITKEFCFSQNVPFLNFSKDSIFLNNRSLFSDISHLNHNGALILSNLVVERIKLDINK